MSGKWININKADTVDLSDAPRKLTITEINDIISRLPTINAADTMSVYTIATGVRNALAKQLFDIELCPSAIPNLIVEIIASHNKALIEAGTPVGVLAAESLSAVTTQMTLNTFHTSGSAKSASTGIKALRDIIFASKNPSNEMCFVYFKDKKTTFDEAQKYRAQIVGSPVISFIKDHEIDSLNNLQSFWWHEVAPDLLQKNIPIPTTVLRLYLDLTAMYENNVTMSDLAKAIEGSKEDKKLAVAVYGPLQDAIMDVYPTGAVKDYMNGLWDENDPKAKNKIPKVNPMVQEFDALIEQAFLENIVMPEFETLRVKGVRYIKDVRAVITPVTEILSKEEFVTSQPGGINVWTININPDKIRSSGVPRSNLNTFMRTAIINVPKKQIDKNKYEVGVFNPFKAITETRKMSYEDVMGYDKDLINRIDHSIDKNGNVIMKQVNPKVLGNTIKITEGNREISVRFSIYEITFDVSVIFNYMMSVYTGYSSKDQGIYYKIYNDVVLIDYFKTLLESYTSKNKAANVSIRFVKHATIPNKGYLILDADYAKLKHTPTLDDLKPGSPITVAKKWLDAEKAARKDEIKKAEEARDLKAKTLPREERIVMLRQPVVKELRPVEKAYEFINLETQGQNLRQILNLPFVDKSMTYCNNMHVMSEIFGIEVARAYIMRALRDILASSDGYIHPMHIMLIAEFITNRGTPYGATYTGISRQPVGHIALATLEKAGTVLINAAIHQRKESALGTSAAIALGKRIAIGTGSFIPCMDVNGETYIDDQVYDAWKNDPNQVPTIAPELLMSETPQEVDGKVAISLYDRTQDEETTGLQEGEIAPDLFQVEAQMEEEAGRIIKISDITSLVPTTVPQPVVVPDLIQLTPITEGKQEVNPTPGVPDYLADFL